MTQNMSNTLDIIAAPGIIIVEPLEEQTSGKITISDQAKEKDAAGVVLAVGSEKPSEYYNMLVQVPVNVGDKIIHKAWGTETYLHKGKRIRFLRFQDYLGTIKE